jgi:4-diphosphocytidyl-2-C-methyl-D-erythritol kinase
MTLTVHAPGKVNPCLFLGPLRRDGRHELVTVIESVSLSDELTVVVGEDGPDQVNCPDVPEPNLVSVALQALRARGWNGPPLTVEILKRLPVAAGMGGGSADAAALLRAAQLLSPLADETLHELAAELGADVPSQLEPGLMLASGAGERLIPLPPLPRHALLIVPQSFPLSTTEVYAEADRLGLPRGAGELEALRERLLAALTPGAGLSDEVLINDLEAAARSLRPEVGDALEAVRASGADQTLVSGSGPTVVGLFWGDDGFDQAQTRALELDRRFPGAVAALPVGADAGRPGKVA